MITPLTNVTSTERMTISQSDVKAALSNASVAYSLLCKAPLDSFTAEPEPMPSLESNDAVANARETIYLGPLENGPLFAASKSSRQTPVTPKGPQKRKVAKILQGQALKRPKHVHFVRTHPIFLSFSSLAPDTILPYTTL